MKPFFYTILIFGLMLSCNSSKSITENSTNKDLPEDTVRIANDDLEYEIIIFDPGFSTWLKTTAKPKGYYSQGFLELRNQQYVIEWNQRVYQPSRYRNLYEMTIDYDPNIDYGYEVNYNLYNYFIYFQITNKQQLTGQVPRI
jgi:hypothetical protein